MVKKTTLFALPKFGSLRDSTLASLKIGEILALRKSLASFLNWGSHLFYVNFNYLLTDLLHIQTKLTWIRSNATRPLAKEKSS